MSKDNQVYRDPNGSDRVRHVPIYVESMSDTLYSGGSENNQNRLSRTVGQSNSYQGHTPDSTSKRHMEEQHRRQINQRKHTSNFTNQQQDLGQHNQTYLPSDPSNNTSSIDICYRPDSKQSIDSRHYQRQQQQPQQQENSQHSQGRNRMNSSRSQHSEEPNSPNNTEPNKENKSNSNSLKVENDRSDTDDRPSTPKVIPLPPPSPQNNRSSNEDQDHQKPHFESSKTVETQGESDIKKPKKELGQSEIIMETKQEVNRLLQLVANCNETSSKSKEFLRLDELLTRCILKLDDVQCGNNQDLRQQRRSVIELIDKCTDILQRKVQLNHDILQLTSRSTQ